MFLLRSAFFTAFWYFLLKSLIRRIDYFLIFHSSFDSRLIFWCNLCIFIHSRKLNQVILQIHICCTDNFFLVWEWEVGFWWFFCRENLNRCFSSFGPRHVLLFPVCILHSSLRWFFLHLNCWVCLITSSVFLGIGCI